MKIDRDIFGLFLFAKRHIRVLSVRALAKAAGVPTTAVERAEERRPISPRQFEKLCRWQGEDPEIFARRPS